MKIAYFDCFSGISGDMCLGALVDLGLPLTDLSQALAGLRRAGFTLRRRRVMRGALSATKVDVLIEKRKDTPLAFTEIRRQLKAARLPREVRDRSVAVFERLAVSEAHTHRSSIRRVHFHELGSLDSLIDVVGTILGCHLLGIEGLYCSSVNVGTGIVKTAHGVLPVPTPATARLLQGCLIHTAGPAYELTTPTGAALMATLATIQGSMPAMTMTTIGHGAGNFNPPDWPNVLRIIVGETISAAETDRVMVLETNLDDMNPQAYEVLTERLFAEGALDVTLTPVIMKRGRPGIILTVLVHPAKAESLLRVIFAETTTLGIRIQDMARRMLSREMTEVVTKFGPVRIKVARVSASGKTKAQPEYRDLKRIAEATGLPIRTVMREVERSVQRRPC